MPEDERSAKFMISIIKDMKSIKENCNFVQVNNEDTAYKMVEEGEAYGAIIIPKHFVRDIMDGTNTPAIVLLPDKSSIEVYAYKGFNRWWNPEPCISPSRYLCSFL